MNIFLVSYDHRTCARALDDVRLNKMMLETAQILCTVLNLDAEKQVTQYRNSHAGNKHVLWARENPHHWSWLWQLGMAYGEEIIHRFGRKHASHLVVEGLTFNWPWLCKPGDRPKHWVNGAARESLNLDFTHLPVREAYREYLIARWKLSKKSNRPPKWTKRGKPAWYS